MSERSLIVIAAVTLCTVTTRATDQVWYDAGIDNIWSANALNWDAGGAWANGNNAVFAGAGGALAGETVDVSNAVVVANITFQTNGYTVADADANGTLTFGGTPSVITVVNAGDTGTVSEVIGGVGGFTKTGNGLLCVTAANTYTGATIVSAGTLKLYPNALYALGVTGTGNDTVVENGATLDLNGCYAASRSYENFTVSGTGVGGKGVLVNNGANHNNNSVGSLTLQGDALISSNKRIDANTVNGNGHTLTKIGGEQFCVQDLQNAQLVINEGTYTLLANDKAMGGTTPGDTIMNAGTLNAWNTMTVPERITFNGGKIQQGNPNRQLFTLTGHLTLNSVINISSTSITTGVDVAGFVDGTGGFSMDQGWIYVTGNTNTYSGPTIINGGRSLYVGKTNLYSGVLGTGIVTNYGTVYGYSRQITGGGIVNYGSIYCNTGMLCVGSLVNSGSLYLDRAGTFVCSNAFFGTGTTYLRYGGDMVVSGSFSSNAIFKIGQGTLSLTNGAEFRLFSEMQVADKIKANMGYPEEPANVTAVVNVPDGCTLTSQAITFGNGTTGNATGILNQAGGLVLTTGKSAEDNGIRLGHYPAAYSVYNMMGGTLIVGKDYDLSCATDGRGWFNMTGGEVFATRVMLNERTGSGGSGRLTVAGGVLNVGTLNIEVASISNGITVDAGGPYLVEYGGAGGVVRAVTNFTSDLNATLYGADADAITFDTQALDVRLSGVLTGAGGLNKAGAGLLTLGAQNSYSGGTFVAEGRLSLGVADALTNTFVSVAAGAALDLGGFSQKLGGVGGNGVVSNGVLSVKSLVSPGVDGIGSLTLDVGGVATGGMLFVDVTTNGTCDVLHVMGDLDLTGMTLAVADAAQLNTRQGYTIATYTGSLAGAFDASNLPKPWYVMRDRVNKRVQLRSENGTMLRVK